MKIGMILDIEFPPDPRVENEAIELIKGGHEVFLFCLKYGDEPSNEIVNGIKVCRYKTNKIDYKFSALAYTVPYYTYVMKKKIAHFIETYKIKAIHIHDMRIAEAVFKANKKISLPTTLDMHDNTPEVMQFYPHLNKFPGKYIISPKKWKKKEEEFLAITTNFVATSPEYLEEVVARTKISRKKIHLVPNTVRESFYKDAKIDNSIVERYKDNFVLLYLGDTGLRRGLPIAIDTVNLLKDKIPNIKLVIVGKSTTDNILKQQVAELGLQEYVDFEGWQNVELFPSYIVASTIGISPLTKNFMHEIMYSNKVFQYMSLSLPVLISNCKAQQKVVEENNSGLIFEAGNIHDFADKVLKLYADKELSNKLGENGKRFIEEKFNWSITSRDLIKLYDNLEN